MFLARDVSDIVFSTQFLDSFSSSRLNRENQDLEQQIRQESFLTETLRNKLHNPEDSSDAEEVNGNEFLEDQVLSEMIL